MSSYWALIGNKSVHTHLWMFGYQASRENKTSLHFWSSFCYLLSNHPFLLYFCIQLWIMTFWLDAIAERGERRKTTLWLWECAHIYIMWMERKEREREHEDTTANCNQSIKICTYLHLLCMLMFRCFFLFTQTVHYSSSAWPDPLFAKMKLEGNIWSEILSWRGGERPNNNVTSK